MYYYRAKCSRKLKKEILHIINLSPWIKSMLDIMINKEVIVKYNQQDHDSSIASSITKMIDVWNEFEIWYCSMK